MMLWGSIVLTLWATGNADATLYSVPMLVVSLTMSATYHSPGIHVWQVLPWMLALSVASCLLVPSSGTTVQPL